MRHAWNTVYIDDQLGTEAIRGIRDAYGHYTRKLWVQVTFRSIVSHYRRRYSLTVHGESSELLQPFCELTQWPHIEELEIDYAHKCAFPGLAAYLEPRLGTVKRLTICGQVPVDMRRAALLLYTNHLEEIHFRALPRGDDSVSVISGHRDPILQLPVGLQVRVITLTALIDIRIIRAVLAKARGALEGLNLEGLTPSQLIVAGVSCQDISTSKLPAAQCWTRLTCLGIRLVVDEVDDDEGGAAMTLRLVLDAAEFPQLVNLRVVSFGPPLARAIAYGKTFSRSWPSLRHLTLPGLGNGEAWCIARNVANLSTLRVSGMVKAASGLFNASGLLSLLASPLPLAVVSIDYCGCGAIGIDMDALDFDVIRKGHSARIVDATYVALTQRQRASIRRSCPRLATLAVCGSKADFPFGRGKVGTVSEGLARIIRFWRSEGEENKMHAVNKPVRIAIAGGNFGGLGALKGLYVNLLGGPGYDGTAPAPANPQVRITLIDRRDGFVHSLGLTRGLSQAEYGRRLWIGYDELPWMQHPSITVRQDVITRITPTHIELADTSERVEFDYLVVALGLSRKSPMGVGAATRKEYLDTMGKYQGAVGKAQSIAVVGGGAVGVELAADLKTDFPDKDIVLLHSRQQLVPGPYMEEFREETVQVLRKLGVRLVLGERVTSEASEPFLSPGQLLHSKHANVLPELVDSVTRNATLTTSVGTEIQADLVFRCLGATTKRELVDLPSSTDTPVFGSGGIRIRASQQVDDPKLQHIFAVGDVSDHAPVAKFAGAAVRCGQLAGNNISQLVRARTEDDHVPELAQARKRDGGGYGRMKLVLGTHNTVIQAGNNVIGPEKAAAMSSPDIKLSKVIAELAVGRYPTE
ncbi:hypothetical protein GGF46_002547 [Coemansia sp. RSA 552]|nr:hypothetical protein GGF46_002547 [Coemansia sp. RSA 552]